LNDFGVAEPCDSNFEPVFAADDGLAGLVERHRWMPGAGCPGNPGIAGATRAAH
jgi:hypothetical protein